MCAYLFSKWIWDLVTLQLHNSTHFIYSSVIHIYYISGVQSDSAVLYISQCYQDSRFLNPLYLFHPCDEVLEPRAPYDEILESR